jgi:hypothetical protein
VLETPGVSSGLDTPTAGASIVEIYPYNHYPEVYFSSFSGGIHCCWHVIVAEEVCGKWVAVPIGDFDGEGHYLADLDGDGRAEIATVDNRFLYAFDCYACSAAPLVIMTVRSGKAIVVTTDPRFLAAHRDWLKLMEGDIDPTQRWTSRGFLAGWLAEKVRIGEGAEAWKELSAHWDSASDVGETVCLSGGDTERCPKDSRASLNFLQRLKLFLDQSGYRF